MATYDELMTAVRRAHAAGDTDAARRLAQMAQAARTSQAPAPSSVPMADAPPSNAAALGALLTREGQAARRAAEAQAEPPGFLRSLARGVRDGVSLGFNDELAGALAVPLGAETGADGRVRLFDYSRSAGDRYAGTRDAVREGQQASREGNPWAYGGGQVAGGAATSIGAMPSAIGRTFMGTAGRTLGLGALEGGVTGAGNADGAGVLAQAGQGAALGAALGPVAAGGMALGRAVTDPVVGAIQAVRGRPFVGRAGRTVASVMSRAGATPESLDVALSQAALEGQGAFVTADALGHAGQRALSGVARQPGEGRQAIVEALTARQGDQADRVGGFVTDALGLNGTASQTGARMTAARGAEANALYGAARQNAGAVNLNGTLEVIDTVLRRDPILGETSLSQGPLGARMQALRDRLGNDAEQLIDFDSVLNIKTDLFRAMQRNSDVQGDLMPAYRALDAALEEASPGYRAANDTYRRRSGDIEAIELGAVASRPGVRFEDSLDQFGSLTPEGQAAFRTGFGDRRLAAVEAATPGTNVARPFTTTRTREIMEALASDPARFQRQIEREGTMFETGRQALGGSQTADNLADQMDMNGAGDAVGIIANVLAGRFGAAAAGGTRALASAGTGMNEQTRALIAQALLSRDPQAALRPLLASAQSDARQMRAAEAFLRQLGYRAADQVRE